MTAGKITVSFDTDAKRAIDRLTKALERNQKHITVVNNSPEEYSDEGTMTKVFEALRENGYLPDDIPNVISSFQNRGILFRERR